jgi:D-alanine-D-alanine ligase
VSEQGRKHRVMVLFGGRSAEHEISILSARFVVESLDRDRFEPVLVGITKEGRWVRESEAALLAQARDPRLVKLNAAPDEVHLAARPATTTALAATHRAELLSGTGAMEPVDVVFPVLHGPLGEDGTLQGLLRLAEVPFVGSGVLGSAVGMDKDVMKRLFREAGLPIVPHVTLRAIDRRRSGAALVDEVLAVGAGAPVFVKPANLGSSVGVSKVTNREEAERALELAFSFDEKIVAERGVDGVREIECGVLGNDEPIASAVGEIVVTHRDGFYSYDAKYVDPDGSHTQIPADLPPAEIHRAQELAVRAFEVLGCEGLARVDFFRSSAGELFLNEVNTLPGFTAISMYPKLFEAAGVGARELVTRLVDLALERAAARSALRTTA